MWEAARSLPVAPDREDDGSDRGQQRRRGERVDSGYFRKGECMEMWVCVCKREELKVTLSRWKDGAAINGDGED